MPVFGAGDVALRDKLTALLNYPQKAWRLPRRGARVRHLAERRIAALLGEIREFWANRVRPEAVR